MADWRDDERARQQDDRNRFGGGQNWSQDQGGYGQNQSYGQGQGYGQYGHSQGQSHGQSYGQAGGYNQGYGNEQGRGGFGWGHPQGMAGQQQNFGQGHGAGVPQDFSGRTQGYWQNFGEGQAPAQGQSQGFSQQQQHQPYAQHQGLGQNEGGFGGRSMGFAGGQSGGAYTGQTGTGYGQTYGGQQQQQHGQHGGQGWMERAKDRMSSVFGGGDHEGGRHRGRGPSNYSRSDERIRDDVNDRLTDDPFLDATDIMVMAEKGEVTLSGTVHTREDKRRAEDLADNVSGVKHVQNNLRVGSRASGSGSGSGDEHKHEGLGVFNTQRESGTGQLG